ncbi:MAG: M20/M25/M40 family metallo-hydrolase [bacterium]
MRLVIAATAALCAAFAITLHTSRGAHAQAADAGSASHAADATNLAERYHEAAARLIGEAQLSPDAYDKLAFLCDRIGHRLSGSPRLDRAIEWAAGAMRADGLANVHTEKVMVPAWVRGAERATVLEPAEHELSMLGIGMSVGTPRGGITADVVVVDSFPHLDSLGEAGVRGKIVLFDVPYAGYGNTVPYRTRGASRAAKYGAAAVLVRSVGPISFDTPHTGTLMYAEDQPKIPAACITIENATMMRRMSDRGERMRVRLEMGAHQLEDAPSANVIGEVVGRELPDEIVVVSGHLDSWDVGQGAQDDGVGCILAMEAAHLIQRLGLAPRRTIRVVLFTNEENGARGGNAYRDTYQGVAHNHVAAIESDSGNGPVQGFSLDLRAIETGDSASDARAEADVAAARVRGVAILRELAPLFEPLGATGMVPGGSGVDVEPMVKEGVAGIGVRHDTSRYFDVHHTHADTFEKIDRADLNRNVAAMAVLAYVLADMPERLAPPRVIGTH